MSSGGSGESIDVLRKGGVVVLLVAAVVGLHRFGTVEAVAYDPTGMLALGFVILASYTFGELVGVVGLPHITGYLFAGLLLGPSVASTLPPVLQVPPFDDGILNEDVIEQLGLFDTLALALIAITAGGELKIRELREGLRDILGALGGQLVLVPLVIVPFVVAIGGTIPGIGLPALSGESLTGLVAFGLLTASISLATSPAATIAVINSTGATGPTTKTVLSAVVMKDVLVVLLFSLASAFAVSAVSTASGEVSLARALGVEILGSLVVGAAIGGLLAFYLRFVRAEILLFLLAVVFTAAYAADVLHLDPPLLFIAAGFTASNFAEEGDTLIHEVETLSMPVYVVFFTLAGAGLHLDSLGAMLPYALALVGLRALAVWGGVGGAARLLGSPDGVRRYGWMGFLSQAGVAITLAAIIGRTYGEPGAALETLIIAGVALNEVIGPVALKVALGLAKEIPSTEREGEGELERSVPDMSLSDEEDEPTDEALPAWQPPERVRNPWGEPLDSGSDALDQLSADLKADLQGLMRDLMQGPMARFRERGAACVQQLRKEFLRHHRRVMVRAEELARSEGAEGAELASLLRAEQNELTEAWREVVLTRAAATARNGWSPARLVEVIDGLADGLPAVVMTPFPPDSLSGHGDDGAWRALSRAWLNVSVGVQRTLGADEPQRRVAVRELAAYHFTGRLPLRLEALAALLVNGEEHLAMRIRSLLETVIGGYDALIERAEQSTCEDLPAALQVVRQDVEDEFALALEEMDRIAEDGTIRTARVLGDAFADWNADLRVAGTPDLPMSRRRFSRVYPERTRGLDQLNNGLEAARAGVAARFASLALELELVGLETRVKDVMRTHGEQLARNVRGRGATQVHRALEALDVALEQMRATLEADGGPTLLARELRRVAEPLEKVAGGASRTAAELRDQLARDQAIAPLLDALFAAARDLTERYVVPDGPRQGGEWALPPPGRTVEVPFREVVVAFFEAKVTRDLLDLTQGLGDDVQRLAAQLDEFERVVAFNVELATGELDLLEEAAVSTETRELVHDMVVGTLTRSQRRLSALHADASTWGDRARDGVRDAVSGELAQLRAQVEEGRVDELRNRLLREAAASRRRARESGGLEGLLETGVEAVRDASVQVLGKHRITRLREVLGLPEEQVEQRADPSVFGAGRDAERVPVVYRRLFSNQALEAGDLLTGRRAELDRAWRALAGASGGRLRSAAVIGPEGVGKRAFTSSVMRKLDVSVRRIALTEPVAPAEVDRWFAEAGTDQLVVIEGFAWLFALSPGGVEPLRRLTAGIIRDGGANAWLVSADIAGWRFASRAAGFDDAFAEIVELRPLSEAELADALLARHAMSGYDVAFAPPDASSWSLDRLLGRRDDLEAAAQEAWFHTLFEATGGMLHDALRLWMGAIERIDENKGVVHLGPVPVPPVAAVRQLPDLDLLTLRQVFRQGWMTAEAHARLFRTDTTTAEAHLAHLEHLGLIVSDRDRYRVAAHLSGPIGRVLRDKGWGE